MTYRTKGTEREACLNWYHLGCGNISESEYADIAETVWYCFACKKQQEAGRAENSVKVFLRYVDDIFRTVKGDPGLVVLEAARKLHPNLQFTIEELDSNGNLAFLDLNVNVDSGKKVTCGWYQKPTDTGTILNFRYRHHSKVLIFSPPFHNAISRQSISTVRCKGSANIRGTKNFYNKKIDNMLAISQNFLCS